MSSDKSGEGCKGTATLSGDSLVFAFSANQLLESSSEPAQSLCNDTFTFSSSKPASCQPPVERGSAELETVRASLATVSEELRTLRNTVGSGSTATSFPHPCNDLDPKLHTEISGMAGQCAPNSSIGLVRAGWLTTEFEGAPNSYSDSNEMSMLLGPKKEKNETSTLSSSERKQVAARVKKVLYLDTEGPKRCKAKFVEAVGKLSVDCEMPMRDIYTSGSASLKRTQKCETSSYTPSRCKSCSDHGDCDRMLCGCSESRCTVFGRCTGCRTEYSRDCEDPVFTMKGVNDWKLSKNVAEDQKLAAELLADNLYGSEPAFLFRMASAYRRVYRTKKYDEWKTERDSGYVIKATPLLLGYQTAAGPVVMYSASFAATHEADGKSFDVKCDGTGSCLVAAR